MKQLVFGAAVTRENTAAMKSEYLLTNTEVLMRSPPVEEGALGAEFVRGQVLGTERDTPAPACRGAG